MAVAPTIGFLELPVRAKASMELMKMYSTNTLGIETAALAIWLINLVIPALIGSILILGIKIKKENSFCYNIFSIFEFLYLYFFKIIIFVVQLFSRKINTRFYHDILDVEISPTLCSMIILYTDLGTTLRISCS